MTQRRADSRTALRWIRWVVAAFLLKGAMPFLAVAAAELQGRPLADVCPVYGVRTVVLAAAAPAAHADGHAQAHHVHQAEASRADQSDQHHQHHTQRAAGHGDHCALAGMLAVTAPEAWAGAVTAVAASGSTALPAQTLPAPDATALWVARLKHGPPALG